MKLSKTFEELKPKLEIAISENLKGFRGVMVGCSGGADSTALFHLLCEVAKPEKNFLVGLIHVNFGLRGDESDADERFVRDLANSKNVPLTVKKPADYGMEFKSGCGQSVQEWARAVRQRAFKEIAESGFAVGLAHHQDDLAETILMRMARGSAPHNLKGMSEWRAPFWRPLLEVPKKALVELLGINDLSHRNDSSNDKMDYTRNVVRHRVLTELDRLYPGAARRIVECANEAQDISQFCRESLQTTSSDSFAEGLPIKFLRSLNRSVATLVLRDFFTRSVGSQKHVSREFLRQTLAWATSVSDDYSGAFQDVRGGFRVVAEAGVIRLKSIPPKQQENRAKGQEFGVYAVNEVTL